jgi:phasin family protein
MNSKPEDFFMQAWKQQLDIGLRVMETLVEGATKLREMQLEAATQAHADLEATRRSIASASDVSRLLELHTQWTQANARKCADYWRGVYDVAVRTQTDLAGCFAALPAAATPAAPVDESKQALLQLLDGAYKQWLEATQQFYKLPAFPPAARPDRASAAENVVRP